MKDYILWKKVDLKKEKEKKLSEKVKMIRAKTINAATGDNVV